MPRLLPESSGTPFRSSTLSFLFVLLLLPSSVFAQAAITGVVRDTSGAVLPGVTVEAASPVLIEKVRSVISDDTGQYRIVDLRPGTYSVTFTLPGFSTIRRDGVELTGDFVATINADLKVGALEETITVTGETPVVDVQSVRQQTTVSKDVIAAIPVSRNASGITALIPGMSTNSDNGNIGGGIGGGVGTIHGGRGNDSRTYADGINTGWAGGSAGGGNMAGSTASAQEVVVNTSGGLGEAETSGVVLNVIPREGSNTFSGGFSFSGANDAMQGSNFTQDLQDRGLETPEELISVYDVTGQGGGRIIRDKLWFYLTYRETQAKNKIPGMFFNNNAGNPNEWSVDFDRSRPAFSDGPDRNGIGRITWQATPRNKIGVYWSEQYNASAIKGGGGADETPEADGGSLFQPSHIQQATWSSPLTSRLLAEAGWGTYQARYRNPRPRQDGSHHPRMIRATEQDDIYGIANLDYRMPAGVGGGFNHHLIGTLANNRASLSYVTGAHNMKFGYQGGFNNPSQTYTYFNEVIHVRLRGGAPNRLTQVIVQNNSTNPFTNAPNPKIVRNLLPTSLYAQDQWTRNRLTLQGGVRWDHLVTNYPDSTICGEGYTASCTKELVYPKGSTQSVKWDDVTPRMGVAYDLFGNGKTAVKFNIGKYMQAFSATNTDLDLNPIIRTTISTTRTWGDSNGDFVPNCVLANPEKNGECGAMDDKSLGKEVFTRTYDPDFIEGYGVRPYSWNMGVQVQQELMPRVSVNVGYFRNWWGNWYAVDNTPTTAADYTPFSIPIPVDPRLPGGGGGTVTGLYNLVPDKVGQVNEFATLSKNLGEQQENWQGVDVNVTARLRNGITAQGGTSTGRRLSDACGLEAAVPEQGTGSRGANTSIAGGSLTNPYCRVVEPYRTQIRGLASYTIPRIDVLVSGTWSLNPGGDLAANYVVNNAVARPSLGRDLSSGNVTVNLIPPETFFAERRNNVDLRLSKILRYGRTRTQVGVDVYNLMNNDTVTGFSETYSPTSTTWLTPQDIVPARYVRFNLDVNF
jgi:carboxypeptidase family protein